MADKIRCHGNCFVEIDGNPMICEGCEDCNAVGIPKQKKPEDKTQTEQKEPPREGMLTSESLARAVEIMKRGTILTYVGSTGEGKDHECSPGEHGEACPECYKAGFMAGTKTAKGEELTPEEEKRKPIGFDLDGVD